MDSAEHKEVEEDQISEENTENQKAILNALLIVQKEIPSTYFVKKSITKLTIILSFYCEIKPTSIASSSIANKHSKT